MYIYEFPSEKTFPKEMLEGKASGHWGSSGRGVEEAVVVDVVRCIGGGV